MIRNVKSQRMASYGLILFWAFIMSFLLCFNFNCYYGTDPEATKWIPREVAIEVEHNTHVIERYQPPTILCTGWVTNVDSVYCSVKVELVLPHRDIEGDLWYAPLGPRATAIAPGGKVLYTVTGCGHGVDYYKLKFTSKEHIPNR